MESMQTAKTTTTAVPKSMTITGHTNESTKLITTPPSSSTTITNNKIQNQQQQHHPHLNDPITTLLSDKIRSTMNGHIHHQHQHHNHHGNGSIVVTANNVTSSNATLAAYTTGSNNHHNNTNSTSSTTTSPSPYMNHEAFAAQVRTIMKAAGLISDKVNWILH